MSTKVTIKEQFYEVLDVLESVGNDELAEFIKGRISALEKKSTGERKPSKEKIANDGIREALVASMVPGTVYSLAQLTELVPELNGASSQKMVGVLKTLVNKPDEGITDRPINKTMDKRKAFYSLA